MLMRHIHHVFYTNCTCWIFQDVSVYIKVNFACSNYFCKSSIKFSTSLSCYYYDHYDYHLFFCFFKNKFQCVICSSLRVTLTWYSVVTIIKIQLICQFIHQKMNWPSHSLRKLALCYDINIPGNLPLTFTVRSRCVPQNLFAVCRK